MLNLKEILRDIAAEKRNEIGDYRSLEWCKEAANYIEQLEKELAEYSEAQPPI